MADWVDDYPFWTTAEDLKGLGLETVSVDDEDEPPWDDTDQDVEAPELTDG